MWAYFQARMYPPRSHRAWGMFLAKPARADVGLGTAGLFGQRGDRHHLRALSLCSRCVGRFRREYGRGHVSLRLGPAHALHFYRF